MGVSLIYVTSCDFSRHYFWPVEKPVWSSHALDQQNHEGQKRAVHSTGPRKYCSLWPKFWWLGLLHFFFPQTDAQQWFRRNWCHKWCTEKEGNAQPSVCINTTRNVSISVCRYAPMVCKHKAFTGLRKACRILIRICTTWMSKLSRNQHGSTDF